MPKVQPKRKKANPTRIREWRKQRGLTLEKLAERVGVTAGAISQLERGEVSYTQSMLEALAGALGCQPADLLLGESRRQIPLVGHVGAGAEALLYAAGQGPFDEVDAPDGSTDATVAVEVRGESLGALFDRWLVFYDDVRDPPGHREIGKLCVVGLTDGRVLVKKLVRGQLPGLFTLLSNVEPPIYDVAVEWAARVTTMQPR